MSTSYEVIYANFLSKIKSYEVSVWSEEELKEYLHDYLLTAISKFHVCRKDLSDRDDEIGEFNVDLSLEEIEILTMYAIMEYIDSTYIRTPTLLKSSLSSSDFNSYSPANQLTALRELQAKCIKDIETLVARYSWMGSKDSEVLSSISDGYYKKG